MIKQIKCEQLSMQIMRHILEEMQTGVYSKLDRLPPEIEIAEALGVSRTVVRDSLAMLEREGFVSRKHGLGTIINRHILEAKTRVDLEKEFFDMVRDAGYKPSVKFLNIEETNARKEDIQLFGEAAGTDVIRVNRVVYADDMPAIYCIDTISKSIITDPDYTHEDLQKTIFEFMEKFCSTDVYMDLTEMQAINADTELAQILDVAVGSAVLHLNEHGYDFKGKLILHSKEYYREGIFHHTILRKKI